MSSFRGFYDIRDYKPEDRNFVISTFLRGLYYGDSWFSLIPKDIFMKNYKAVAEALIAKRTIKVACLREDPDVIIGYSILSNDFQTIDWVYVKSSKQPDGTTWRNKGVGKSLVPQYPTSVSHLTVLGKELLKKFPNTVFNPFSIT